jgi:hypothetical protein
MKSNSANKNSVSIRQFHKMKKFQETQLAFSRHMRAPDEFPAPEGMEDRRMGIYRDLVYNNIESMLAGVFPVLRSLLSNAHWHNMVRDFIRHHECKTPYFLEISEEFLQYLAQERGLREGDPQFMLELAHYEWIELALDVSEDTIPSANEIPIDLLSSIPRVSPLVANLVYQYPVHKISPHFQPLDPEQAHLVVYRNRDDKVCFMEANPITQRLLSLLQTQSIRLSEAIQIIADELQHKNIVQLTEDAMQLVKRLFDLGVLSHFE